MIHVFFADNATDRNQTTVFTALDRPVNKEELEDTSVDLGFRPPDSVSKMRSGRHVKPDTLARRIRPGWNRRGRFDLPNFGMPHVMKLGYGQLVSDAFRKVIEVLDPGAHQFAPVTFEWKDGPGLETYSWFVPGNRIFPVDPDTTDVRYFPTDGDAPVVPQEHSRAFLVAWSSVRQTGALTFHKNVVGECDVFVPGELNEICMTQRALDALSEAGINGYSTRGPYKLRDI